MNKSPERLTDISGEQWLFETFSAADSSYSAIQETVNARRGSESGNNQFNSFLQGGVEDGTGSADTAAEETDLHVLEDQSLEALMLLKRYVAFLYRLIMIHTL